LLINTLDRENSITWWRWWCNQIVSNACPWRFEGRCFRHGANICYNRLTKKCPLSWWII